MANVGETQSKGFELTLATYNMSKQNFKWKTMFTL
jgi:hypothetical protein